MLIGRESKLDFMERYWKTGEFHFMVLYGGPKTGKSAVCAAFAKEKPVVFFSAQKLNSYMNLRLFERAVSAYSSEEEHFGSWKEAFSRIADFAQKGRFLLVIEDFADLVFGDREIFRSFRAAMNREWKGTGLYVLASCGRVFFTESEIIAEDPDARASVRRPVVSKLDSLDYFDAAKLLPQSFSPADKLRFYGCLGGIPEYLSLVREGESFEENIRRIFLTESAPLLYEPPRLFLDELREPEFYHSILSAIADGACRINEIVAAVGESSTKVNKYLLTLLQMQAVTRETPFGEESRVSRKGIYSISEESLAFWFRFVMPNITAIRRGEAVGGESLPAQIDAYLSGRPFRKICGQYLQRGNRRGTLPFLGASVGGYWSSLKEYADSRLVVANPRSRQILFGHCCWGDAPADAAALGRLTSPDDKLFLDFWERFETLFSIREYARELRNLENTRFRLVDAAGFFK
ncbi:MAG TPA: ATP-binding protein [Oscillospiraceae bacterium]|nr:ATP-binding protein [Oscillospiraceae bacterium]HNW05256.1 ATP-binding protein [Oscillospiraceae bacterium]